MRMPAVQSAGGNATLFASALPRAGLAAKIGAVVLGSLLLAVSAKVQVPFWPVPMTLQSLVIMMLGMAYGHRLAFATVGLYLAQGFIGLPVFAGAAAGPAYFAGPTAGYLFGFLAAATVMGWMAEKGWDRSALRTLAAMSLGHALLFVPGVAWLALGMGWEKALAVGLTPFIVASVVKTGLGAALFLTARRRF